MLDWVQTIPIKSSRLLTNHFSVIHAQKKQTVCFVFIFEKAKIFPVKNSNLVERVWYWASQKVGILGLQFLVSPWLKYFKLLYCPYFFYCKLPGVALENVFIFFLSSFSIIRESSMANFWMGEIIIPVKVRSCKLQVFHRPWIK